MPGGDPGFEFRGLGARLGVHGLFLRDLDRCWYARGVVGVGPDLDAVARWVSAQRVRLRPSRTVLMGNSAGAYAALAVGALADADEVLAFVPRSGLSDEVSAALDDRRLDAQRRAAGPGRHPDLVPLLAREHARRPPARYRTRYRVFHALDNPWDRAHAARLTGSAELVVSAYPRGDHQLVTVLRDCGELDLLVQAALRG